MARLRLPSLRVSVIVLVLLAVLPALGLALYTAAENRRNDADSARKDSLRAAQVVGAGQAFFIDETRQLLIAIAQTAQVRDLDPAVCATVFADIISGSDRYTSLGLVAPNGEIVCSTLPVTPGATAAGIRAFQQALDSGSFALGDYQVDQRVSQAVLRGAYPVRDGRGDIVGVVSAAIDLAWLNAAAATIQLPEGGTLTVIDRTGTILAQSPQSAQSLGQPWPDAATVRDLLAAGNDTGEARDSEGVEQLYGVAPFGIGDAAVAVSVPTSVAFAAANDDLRRSIVALVGVALLAVAAAWIGGQVLVIRPIDALSGSAARLQSGDLSARAELRTGVPELREFSRHFDVMAQGLRERDTELRESEERFRALIQNASDLILVMESDGTVRYAGPASERLLGVEPCRMEGTNGFSYVHPDEVSYARAAFERAQTAAGSSRPNELRLRHADGSWRYVEVVGTNLLADPAVQGIVINARDITARRQAEEQLRRAHAQLEAELARAAEVQAQMLPRAVPLMPGFELAARCIPAREVGGDFYDWQVPSPGILTLTLADVMGKGMPAALLAATVRSAMRSVVRATPPAEAMSYVVNALRADLDTSDGFVTLFLGQLDVASRRLAYVDAGHGLVWMQRSDGRVEELGLRGLPLGILADGAYQQGTLTFSPGDVLILHSDGLLDARPELALDRAALSTYLSGAANADEMVMQLIEIAALSGPPPDDLTIVVLRCKENN